MGIARGVQRGRLQAQDQQARRPDDPAEHLPLPGDPKTPRRAVEGRLPARAVETGDQGRGRPDGRIGPGPGCHWWCSRASFLDLHAVRYGVLLDSALARPVVLVTPRARRPGPDLAEQVAAAGLLDDGLVQPDGLFDGHEAGSD